MPITEENIAVDLSNYSSPMDLQNLFPRPGPLQIEIGSGKGTFLLNQARLHPDINYLGIEWANKYHLYSVNRMFRWQVSNVRLLRCDAGYFIARYIPAGKISVFHIYFPDPWPKTRHHKRRFFTLNNILQVIRCLEAGGQLRLITDHADYFEIIQQLLLSHPQIASHFVPIDFFPADAADAGEWVGTNFERKYLKEGRDFYKLALLKRP